MARRKTGFDLENSLSQLLRRAQQFAADQFTQHVGKAGLTPRQFIVLLAVKENEGLSQTDLVKRTGIDRSTLADMVSRMIDRGLLARKRTKEDARANAVRMTAKGRKALDNALPGAKKAEDAVLKTIPKSTQSSLLKGLTQMIEAGEDAGSAKPAPKRRTAKPRRAANPKPATRSKVTGGKAGARKTRKH